MSFVDPAYARLPVPVNELTATVFAPTCILSGADGQIRQTGMHGLFYSDIRAIAEARLCVGGLEPQPLAHLLEGAGVTRFVSVARGFGDVMADPTVRVERLRRATSSGMTEDIVIRSTASIPVTATVTLDVRCDLTPLELAKSGNARPDQPAVADGDTLTWFEAGLTVTATAIAGTAAVAPAQLRWDVQLAPREAVTLGWSVAVAEEKPFLSSPRRPIEWDRPQVSADDRRLDRLLQQSLDDLAALRLVDPADPESTFLAAGVPFFLTLFGRDSIWAARMMLPLGTELAAGTLRALAARQGQRIDERSGEAPGKILHELRHYDPRVADSITLPAVYYGSVDSTLLWISLLADAWRWGLAEDVVVTLLPNLHAALEWLAEYGDPDGDGFIEYLDRSGKGLANQGWKDSWDAVRFHDGRLAPAPIALCEVQGYAHRAALDAAVLLDHFGHSGADTWRDFAGAMADRFRQRFWVDGPLGPHPAMAIDGTGAPVDSLTSNIGHLLGTGMLSPEEEQTVARLLASPALSGAYGLRTMSTLDRAFAPLSYHCGAVWPHDTAIALLGLVAAGAHTAAAPLVDGLLAAAEAFAYRLPEMYGGDDRAELNRPLPYPGACRPQAWSATAAVTVLQAALGLTADVPNGEIRLRPLPGALGALSVRGLRIGTHTFDVHVDRGGTVEVDGLPPGLHVRTAATAPIQAPALDVS